MIRVCRVADIQLQTRRKIKELSETTERRYIDAVAGVQLGNPLKIAIGRLSRPVAGGPHEDAQFFPPFDDKSALRCHRLAVLTLSRSININKNNGVEKRWNDLSSRIAHNSFHFVVICSIAIRYLEADKQAVI